MQQTVTGIAMWSAWQPDRNLFFNSFFVRSSDGNVAIDPLPLSESDASEIERAGGLSWIVVTNRDHERDARALATRFEARIAASAPDAVLLSGSVARSLQAGDEIGGARVVALDGLKTAGEFALHFPATKTVLVGDALWGDPAGSVRLMPDEKLRDPARAALSLRKLRALRPEHLLVGDGTCIFGGAHRAIWAALEARTDVYVNRINPNDVPWQSDEDDGPWACDMLDVDHLIGAEKLGYRLARLRPGSSFCPNHWHAAEEEFFFILSGSCTLQSPRGEFELNQGDFVAFPTRASGAHKVVNRTAEPCTMLLVANVEVDDVCYYPDSQKVLVEASGLMLRDHPVLDYFDGE